jgi:tRNA-binding EMAP/Myf-like protein
MKIVRLLATKPRSYRTARALSLYKSVTGHAAPADVVASAAPMRGLQQWQYPYQTQRNFCSADHGASTGGVSVTSSVPTTPTTGSSASAVDVASDLSAMEFKVGKVVSVERHPEASGLYVEKIDVGKL